MKEYEIVLFGNGSVGRCIGEPAFSKVRAASIFMRPWGGTCVNVGCIPSKAFIHPADLLVQLERASGFGIEAGKVDIDFGRVTSHTRYLVESIRSNKREKTLRAENLDIYQGRARFVDHHTIDVEGETIWGEKIIIGTGARPFIPPIEGLEAIDLLTNENVFDLEALPRSVAIIGGGYIAVEFGHFFASMGSEVTIIQRSDRLLTREEPEISDLLVKVMSRRMRVLTGTDIRKVSRVDGDEKVRVSLVTEGDGQEIDVVAERLMVATGRRSNADNIAAHRSEIELDGRGFIRVNDRMETSQENIWCIGDANGRHMLKHVANREAEIALHNALNEDAEPRSMDYSAIPHVVFGHPRIASVGLTESEAGKDHELRVETSPYKTSIKGRIIDAEDGLAKAVVEEGTGRILGFHMIGPDAENIFQEVVNVMAAGGDTNHFETIINALHTHPTLPELIQGLFRKFKRKKDVRPHLTP